LEFSAPESLGWEERKTIVLSDAAIAVIRDLVLTSGLAVVQKGRRLRHQKRD